jgi:hypothetical protein
VLEVQVLRGRHVDDIDVRIGDERLVPARSGDRVAPREALGAFEVATRRR